MERVEIMKTDFSDCFENTKQSEKVFLNNKETSIALWSKYIDENSKSYFTLDDNHWIITSSEVELGVWLEDYNDDNLTPIKNILQHNINWELNDTVLFFISRLTVLETTWDSFLNLWINFIECDDDCPIVINKNNIKKEAIVFKPIGSVSFLSAS